MTGEQLFEAIGDISDRYVAEAHREMKKGSRFAWVKWCALAACLCVVIGLAIPTLKNAPAGDDILPGKQENTVPPNGASQGEHLPSGKPDGKKNNGPVYLEAGERIDYPVAVTAPSKLERFETDMAELGIEPEYPRGGAGAGMKDGIAPYFTGSYNSLESDVHDLLDISQLDVEALPVYRVVDALRTGGTGNADYNSIMKRLEQEWYDFFAGTGIEDDPTVVLNEGVTNGPTSEEHPVYLRNKHSLDALYNSGPTFFTFSTLLETTFDTTEANILERAESNVFFKNAAEYLDITDPVVMWRTSDPYLVPHEEIDKHFTIYQASDDIVETMYNIAFKSIRLTSYAGLSYSGRVAKASSVEYVGDGAIRPYEDAVSEAVSVYGVAEEDILAYDIGYYNEITPGYFIPCYRFIVNTHGQYFHQAPDAPEPENLECIDILVPAVELG